MITFITSLLAPLLPWLAGLAALLAGGAALFFSGKKNGAAAEAVKTDAVKAEAAQQAQQAAQQVANAQGEAKAAQAVTDATKDRAEVDNTVATLPAGAAKAELDSDWKAQ